MPVTRLDIGRYKRLAIRSAEESNLACTRVGEMASDRSFRIFLKILGAESRSHRDDLQAALRKIERERSEVEEMAA